jgi:hypothetical protein
MIWDDSGTEGREGSIWVCSSLHLLQATAGHEPPSEPCWDLKSHRFFLSPEEVSEIEASGAQAAAAAAAAASGGTAVQAAAAAP